MAFNPFKKEKGAKAKAPKPETADAALAEKTAEKQEVKTEQKNSSKNFSAVSQNIVKAHVTEKATGLSGQNQYVFVVKPSATKGEIQKSVHALYGVDVARVRIVQVHAKKMRLGRIKGIKKGYKKAIVKVKEGQSIDIFQR